MEQNHTFTVVRTMAEAVEILSKGTQFDAWSLDHDLGLTPDGTSFLPTGYDFLKWAAEESLKVWPKGKVFVHSANPVGSHNMIMFAKNVENGNPESTGNRRRTA